MNKCVNCFDPLPDNTNDFYTVIIKGHGVAYRQTYCEKCLVHGLAAIGHNAGLIDEALQKMALGK